MALSLEDGVGINFEETWFLKVLESDLLRVLDGFPGLDCPVRLLSSLRMGTCSSTGDLFIPTTAPCTFNEVLKEKLIEKLEDLKSIANGFIDDRKHLVVRLNKAYVFSSVLNQVSKSKHKYGMIKKSQFQSCLVLIHNQNSHINTLNTFKLSLLGEHLISFLLFNEISVFVSGLERLLDESSSSSHISCSSNCHQDINVLSELVVEESKKCKFRKEIDYDDDIIVIDGGNLAYKYPLKVGLIKISNSKSKIVNNCAYALHFVQGHGIESSATVHICACNDFDKVVLSGCVNEILGLSHSRDYFICCQGVIVEGSNDKSAETYMECLKNEISKDISEGNVSSDLPLSEMLEHLLDTSLKFTFLAGRTNSTLRLNVSNCETFKRKDGIFVQYNSARLNKLLETFELKVQNGFYKKLPELKEIDFNLLQEKEEWDLLNFIMFFPVIMEEIYNSIFSNNGFYSNKIFLMLKNLSHLFSKYYRRVRVLTGPELQLQKVMFARIWLLKGIHQIMSNSFQIINIKGLKYM